MNTTRPLSRREFVKSTGIAGAAAAMVGGPSLLGQSCSANGKAKNLIFLVVDGMGTGAISLAHHWALRNHSTPLHWTRLYDRKDVVHAIQDTASASSPVTDSSAAASAWGIGQRINNKAVNVTPTGSTPPPLLVLARDAGKATGLVTTCRVTHATPAGFVANVASRDDEDAIAVQYLDRGIDLILGGGLRHFERAAGKQPGVDLLNGTAKEKGYHVVRNRSGLAKAPDNGRLLGLFYDDHLPYVIDRENDPSLSEVPSLETLFQTALARLNHSKRGFALQVEAGRVDHVGHANDPAAILREMLEFDRCIAIAEDFQKRNPDTLVIITTDHGTGGCQLNGWGDEYGYSGPALDRINQFTASFEGLNRHFETNGGFNSAAFTRATGIVSNPEKEAAVRMASAKTSLDRVMIDVFAPDLLEATAVGWTSHNHTGENVELFAFGPGSREIHSFVRNYELFKVMTNALSLKS